MPLLVGVGLVCFATFDAGSVCFGVGAGGSEVEWCRLSGTETVGGAGGGGVNFRCLASELGGLLGSIRGTICILKRGEGGRGLGERDLSARGGGLLLGAVWSTEMLRTTSPRFCRPLCFLVAFSEAELSSSSD